MMKKYKYVDLEKYIVRFISLNVYSKHSFVMPLTVMFGFTFRVLSIIE